jgi:hypothetical protein
VEHNDGVALVGGMVSVGGLVKRQPQQPLRTRPDGRTMAMTSREAPEAELVARGRWPLMLNAANRLSRGASHDLDVAVVQVAEADLPSNDALRLLASWAATYNRAAVWL